MTFLGVISVLFALVCADLLYHIVLCEAAALCNFVR